MAARYGIDATVNRNAGTYGSPTWTPITLVRDVTLNLAKTEGDISTRGSNYKLTAGVMKDAGADFETLWDPADTGFAALLTAYTGSAGATVELLICDGPSGTTGNQGLRAHMSVLDISRSEPLEGAQTAAVKVKPGPYTTGQAPTWFTAA